MQPTPVFLPGESQGQRNLLGCRLWGRTELGMTEATQQQQQQQLLLRIINSLCSLAWELCAFYQHLYSDGRLNCLLMNRLKFQILHSSWQLSFFYIVVYTLINDFCFLCDIMCLSSVVNYLHISVYILTICIHLFTYMYHYLYCIN